MSGGDAPAGSFSRAFSNIVRSEDDVVGLVAYAGYKRGIREEAERGDIPGSNSRNPPPTVVEAYRQAAEQKLIEIVSRAIEQAEPQLRQSAALSAAETAKADLRGHVTARTSFGQALAVNLIAWVVTLALTALIIWLVGKPDLPSVVITQSGKPSPQSVPPRSPRGERSPR